MANDESPTCRHQGRLTINEYTLTKSCEVEHWKVDADEETLSDHIYILFKVTLSEENVCIPREYTTTDYPSVKEELKKYLTALFTIQ